MLPLTAQQSKGGRKIILKILKFWPKLVLLYLTKHTRYVIYIFVLKSIIHGKNGFKNCKNSRCYYPEIQQDRLQSRAFGCEQ